MRIVLTIHHHLDRDSGAPGSTLALAEAYRRAGHDTRILSFDQFPGRLPAQIEMVSFPYLVAASLAARMGRWCDVVDASTGDAWLWSLLPGPRHRRPLLIARSHGLEHTAHAARVTDHRGGLLRLRKRYFLYHGGERLWEVAVSLRRADLTFFLNRFDRDYAVEHLGVTPERASVVHNGIDSQLLGLPRPQPTREDGIGLAVVGRHTHEKGALYLVAALNRILTAHPEVHATLLGTGKEHDEVAVDFHASVRGRVRVLPQFKREDLPQLLAGHELVLSATLTEGFGKALLESMACGLAPVAAAAPGPREIVHDGHNGFLVPPRESESFAAAVERLLAEPDLRLRLRQHAQETAQLYSWDATAAERLRLIEEALSRR